MSSPADQLGAAKALSEDEMLDVLRGLIGRPDAGRMRAKDLAVRSGLGQAHTSEILAGKKPINANIAHVAGYERRVVYVPFERAIALASSSTPSTGGE